MTKPELIALSAQVLSTIFAAYQIIQIEGNRRTKIFISVFMLFACSFAAAYLLFYPDEELKVTYQQVEKLQDMLEKCVERPQQDVKIDTLKKFSSLTFVLPQSVTLSKWEEKTAILDNSIHVGRYYNDFFIGGKNIDQIRIGARTGDGDDLRIVKNPSSNRLEVSYWDKPYFELAYKGRYFSIEVRLNGTNPVYSVTEISSATMELKDVMSF